MTNTIDTTELALRLNAALGAENEFQKQHLNNAGWDSILVDDRLFEADRSGAIRARKELALEAAIAAHAQERRHTRSADNVVSIAQNQTPRATTNTVLNALVRSTLANFLTAGLLDFLAALIDKHANNDANKAKRMTDVVVNVLAKPEQFDFANYFDGNTGDLPMPSAPPAPGVAGSVEFDNEGYANNGVDENGIPVAMPVPSAPAYEFLPAFDPQYVGQADPLSSMPFDDSVAYDDLTDLEKAMVDARCEQLRHELTGELSGEQLEDFVSHMRDRVFVGLVHAQVQSQAPIQHISGQNNTGPTYVLPQDSTYEASARLGLTAYPSEDRNAALAEQQSSPRPNPLNIQQYVRAWMQGLASTTNKKNEEELENKGVKAH